MILPTWARGCIKLMLNGEITSEVAFMRSISQPGVRNSTKTERELVLEKGCTISTKRTGLRKTPEREKREEKREKER